MNPIPRHRISVCRSLFGPVDQEQLRRDLKQKMQEIAEQDSRRWNFNFQTETPLAGRFQWEEIPADCTAAVYQDREPTVCSPDTVEGDEDRASDHEESSGADQENCSNISNITNKRPAEVTPVRRKRTHSKTTTKPINNARITDFFSKRRRTTETKSVLNPHHTSSSEGALCKTIR